MKTMMLALAALAMPAAAHAATVAKATTVGNATDSRQATDRAYGQTFVLNDAFGIAGQRVTSYSFYGRGYGTLTPLLFSREVDGDYSTFTVIGRGTARTIGTPPDWSEGEGWWALDEAMDGGTYTMDFGLVSGSDITTTSTYFGFANEGQGVITWEYSEPFEAPSVPGATMFITEQSNSNGIGDSHRFHNTNTFYDASNGLATRIYSVNATAEAVAPVPEPATWAMMIVGFGMVGGAMRRRVVAAKVRFA